MKRQYMKPAMQVVEIRQRHYLLAGSPDGPDGYSNYNLGTYQSNPADVITDEDEDVIF